MPNPVPIPASPLPSTPDQIARAEAFVAALGRLFAYGSRGSGLPGLETEPTLLVDPNPTEAGGNIPARTLLISDKRAQHFFRQLAHAFAATFEGGGGGPGGSTQIMAPLEMTCPASATAGDIVYFTSYTDVAFANPASAAAMPARGIVMEKPAADRATVLLRGFVEGIYTGLVPGESYIVGPNHRPYNQIPTSPSGATFCRQIIGFALSESVLFLNPSYEFNELQVP
jgi:hypothetical protein